MKFTPTTIPDVMLVEPQIFGDERGFFFESYQAKEFAEMGISAAFVQDNHSGSRQGTLRGLHYQIQQPQGKLLRVIAGRVFDVAVDIRRGSPTFGKWVGTILSADNKIQFWVPPGFAHGFYVLSEWAELIYKTTDYLCPPMGTHHSLGRSTIGNCLAAGGWPGPDLVCQRHPGAAIF